ncbi:DUF3592 domain-containing protein [Streptomyces sp. CBMA123]|uniref:DUF3592 domain-containing protein n=1 Tax=Streptomyces sp. CBMA123 TaxID=1896313 RepID=UPI001661ECE3|nr:DUF3592 domain-containing protein [Streptomyces sp. CBMA123]MBD0694580.1 hypothetical protein [Streptomyces sp. CBMA123]
MGAIVDLFLLVGAAVLAGLAVGFAAAGRATRALRRDGVCTVGRVRKVRWQTTSEGYERRRVTIVYGLPDGRTVELLRRDDRPEGGRYQEGDEVTVLYHPSRPGRGLAVHPVRRLPPPPGEFGLALLSLACALGAAGLLVLMFRPR